MKDYKLKEVKELHVYGRTSGITQPLTLFWTASGIEVNVKATELWIEVEVDYDMYEPWISVTIDGAVVSRQMLVKGRYYLPIMRQMDADTMRNIRILREVQAMSADAKCMLRIHGIRLDGEFCPLEPKAGKIEFIGDSITSGEGLIGARKEQNWNSMVFGTTCNYTVVTTDALNLDYHVISQSGWGTLSSWDGDPKCNIPAYYDKVCGLLTGEQNEKIGAFETYAFDSWQPDVVVISLGTNDAGAFHQPPQYVDEATGELFDQKMNEDGSFDAVSLNRLQDAMVAFLGKVRHYNPNAHILWDYGMMDTTLNECIIGAVERYRQSAADCNVSALELPIVTAKTIGSREHPGEESHRLFAEKLILEIEKYLRNKQ
jgi:hypothetical protein